MLDGGQTGMLLKTFLPSFSLCFVFRFSSHFQILIRVAVDGDVQRRHENVNEELNF